MRIQQIRLMNKVSIKSLYDSKHKIKFLTKQLIRQTQRAKCNYLQNKMTEVHETKGKTILNLN